MSTYNLKANYFVTGTVYTDSVDITISSFQVPIGSFFRMNNLCVINDGYADGYSYWFDFNVKRTDICIAIDGYGPEIYETEGISTDLYVDADIIGENIILKTAGLAGNDHRISTYSYIYMLDYSGEDYAPMPIVNLLARYESTHDIILSGTDVLAWNDLYHLFGTYDWTNAGPAYWQFHSSGGPKNYPYIEAAATYSSMTTAGLPVQATVAGEYTIYFILGGPRILPATSYVVLNSLNDSCRISTRNVVLATWQFRYSNAGSLKVEAIPPYDTWSLWRIRWSSGNVESYCPQATPTTDTSAQGAYAASTFATWVAGGINYAAAYFYNEDTVVSGQDIGIRAYIAKKWGISV